MTDVLRRAIARRRRESNVRAHYFMMRSFARMAWEHRSARLLWASTKHAARWVLGMQ